MKPLIAIIILILSLPNNSIAQYEKIFGNYMQFQKGDTLFAFNPCAIKAKPSNESKTILRLNYGDTITVDSNYSLYLDTFARPKFYKVKVNSKSGYIEQTNISISKINLQSPSDFFLTNQNSFSDTADILIFKFISKNTEKANHSQTLWGHEYSLYISDNKGLDSIKAIICIDYFSEACGMEGGITYLTWDNYQIKELVSLSSVSDADVYYSDEKIIFPADSGGKPNTLIYQSEIGEKIDELTNWWRTTKEEREHTWINKQVEPAFRAKPKEEY